MSGFQIKATPNAVSPVQRSRDGADERQYLRQRGESITANQWLARNDPDNRSAVIFMSMARKVA